MYSPLNLQPPKQIEGQNQPSSDPPSSFKELLQKTILLFFNLSARGFLIIYPVTSFVLRYTIFTRWFLNKTILLIHYLFYPLAQERDDQDQLSPPRFIHRFLLRTKIKEAQQSLGMDINQNVIEVKAIELIEKTEAQENQQNQVLQPEKVKPKTKNSKRKHKLNAQAQFPLIDQQASMLQSIAVTAENSTGIAVNPDHSTGIAVNPDHSTGIAVTAENSTDIVVTAENSTSIAVTAENSTDIVVTAENSTSIAVTPNNPASIVVTPNNSIDQAHLINRSQKQDQKAQGIEFGQEKPIPLQNKTIRKDINLATLEDFMEIEGLTKARAEEIIKYREIHGPFKNIETVTEVRGIGTKTTFALLARFEVT